MLHAKYQEIVDFNATVFGITW